MLKLLMVGVATAQSIAIAQDDKILAYIAKKRSEFRGKQTKVVSKPLKEISVPDNANEENRDLLKAMEQAKTLSRQKTIMVKQADDTLKEAWSIITKKKQ